MRQHTFSNFIDSKTFSFCCLNNPFETLQSILSCLAIFSRSKQVPCDTYMVTWRHLCCAHSPCLAAPFVDLINVPNLHLCFWSLSPVSCYHFLVYFYTMFHFSWNWGWEEEKSNWETPDWDCLPENGSLPGNRMVIEETDRALSPSPEYYSNGLPVLLESWSRLTSCIRKCLIYGSISHWDSC